ncbi:MAG: hypothetical protein ACXVCX_06410 [Ktedonobacterales bacterium]
MAAQFLTTSKLNNIVNMINLGRQSGILRVIRGQGPTREVGQIKFIDGEPAAALLGQLTGHNALSVLMNWGECVYSFDEQAITDVGDGDLSTDAARISSDPGRFMQSGAQSGGLSSGSWPAYGYPHSSPFSQPPAMSPLPPNASTPAPNSGFPTGNPAYGSQPGQSGYPLGQPGYGYAPGASSYPGDAPRNDPFYSTGMLPAQPSSQVAAQQPPAPLSPQVLESVPQRTRLSEHVEQLPLDRRERMVLLLIDGRRTVVDLARLTRRAERELLGVLSHLAGLGLVQMSS